MSQTKKLRVGLLGAGEVAQVIHLPVLALLSHLYTVESICDISQQSVEHCAKKFNIPHATTKPEEVWQNSNVDVVFVLTADEYHETFAVQSIKHDKHVMVEKPMTISIPSAQRIIDAEKQSGKRVFVGYMRRYAPSFVQAFKREVASIPRILYGRVRDFSGPNANFVGQSGTFPAKYTDFPAGSSEEKASRARILEREALNSDSITPAQRDMCRYLGTLGSHDISVMRETLGMPDSIGGLSANEPFYSAILNYSNKGPGKEPFAVTYESGIDGVPVFDAHMAVYGEKKRVMIEYPSPYVKGLPIKVKVDEVNEHGETESREMLTSYEDAYTAELREMWACLVEGREMKTTATDALDDLKIYDMFYQKFLEMGAGHV